MKAVILAAGLGKRLYPYTKDKPKCLVELYDQTIIENQINNILYAGISEVVIILGAYGKRVEQVVTDNNPGLKITFVYNPIYESSNNLMSLWYAREYLKEGFILLNGDVIFHPDMLKLLFEKEEQEALHLLTSTKEEYDEDDMKVQISEDNKILQVNKMIQSELVSAESVGMVRFPQGIIDLLLDITEDILYQKKLVKAWFLLAIELLIKRGINVYPVDVGGYPWVEIDYPKDIQDALKAVKKIKITNV